jgi:hypothetical protein
MNDLKQVEKHIDILAPQFPDMDVGMGHWGRSSSPGKVKNFLFSKSSRSALGSTQPPIQWVPGVLSLGLKRQAREADHCPIRLHGVVLNSLSTGTTFPLPFTCTDSLYKEPCREERVRRKSLVRGLSVELWSVNQPSTEVKVTDS